MRKWRPKIKPFVGKKLEHGTKWLIICVVFLVVIQVLFSIPAPVYILDATWEAGDLITFAGTIVLGFVAWQQNDRLLRVEEDTYIHSNGCMAHISEVNFISKGFIRAKGQLLTEETALNQPYNYNNAIMLMSVKLAIEDNVATLVRVAYFEIKLYSSLEQKVPHSIIAEATNNGFTRVAIGEKNAQFNLSISIDNKKAEEFWQYMQDNAETARSYIDVDMDLEVVTQKNVITSLKCRVQTMDIYEKNAYFGFHPRYKEPISFWFGHNRMCSSDIYVLGEKNAENNYKGD